VRSTFLYKQQHQLPLQISQSSECPTHLWLEADTQLLFHIVCPILIHWTRGAPRVTHTKYYEQKFSSIYLGHVVTLNKHITTFISSAPFVPRRWSTLQSSLLMRSFASAVSLASSGNFKCVLQFTICFCTYRHGLNKGHWNKIETTEPRNQLIWKMSVLQSPERPWRYP
jgi:hypothetical protein